MAWEGQTCLSAMLEASAKLCFRRNYSRAIPGIRRGQQAKQDGGIFN